MSNWSSPWLLGGATTGQDNSGYSVYGRPDLVPAFETTRAALAGLAESLGQPLSPTNIYRSPEHNARVGGAQTSQHLQGTAADIPGFLDLSPEEQMELIRGAQAQGFTSFGVYNDRSLHLDRRPEPTTWAWDASGATVPLETYVDPGVAAAMRGMVQASGQRVEESSMAETPGFISLLPSALQDVWATYTPQQQLQMIQELAPGLGAMIGGPGGAGLSSMGAQPQAAPPADPNAGYQAFYTGLQGLGSGAPQSMTLGQPGAPIPPPPSADFSAVRDLMAQAAPQASPPPPPEWLYWLQGLASGFGQGGNIGEALLGGGAGAVGGLIEGKLASRDAEMGDAALSREYLLGLAGAESGLLGAEQEDAQAQWQHAVEEARAARGMAQVSGNHIIYQRVNPDGTTTLDFVPLSTAGAGVRSTDPHQDAREIFDPRQSPVQYANDVVARTLAYGGMARGFAEAMGLSEEYEADMTEAIGLYGGSLSQDELLGVQRDWLIELIMNDPVYFDRAMQFAGIQ